jgi:hypothetical protein
VPRVVWATRVPSGFQGGRGSRGHCRYLPLMNHLPATAAAIWRSRMGYFVGVSLALAVSLLATFVGFDRDRAFYPTVLIVIASYYGLFAVMGAGSAALARESLVMAGFLLISIVGFKRNLWVLVGGLCAHGLFDLGHARLIANPGVPAWWPA